MNEFDVMKAVSDALDRLDDDTRSRVLDWVIAKYGNEHKRAKRTSKTEETSGAVSDAGRPGQTSGDGARRTKVSKKSKTIISMDKALNLSPAGKLSAETFAASKAPSSAKEKCVVAVYYLRETLGLESVSVQAVFTLFKTVQWPVPANLRNMLAQAGSEGWLDTSSGDNIQLTSLGENLVEYKLPPAKTKKL